ncbi:DUF4386 domain-containing protein [Egicoccus sp. AB-alg6-2]|uniref:DUF4386 domain-containing protein n=1 Tax=Egicoccus sp. AB-alg6-2 TaxID=3242692 RepID=UPI00359EDDFA
MATPARLARLAGALYLLVCVLGAAAHLGVRAGIHVDGDAVATVQNLTANPTVFRLALVADIAMATIFVFVGVTLHLLLRHVDRHAAGAMMVFVAVGAGMILINLLLHQAALLVATDPTYGAPGSDGLVLLLLDLHAHGYALAGIFFGLWLLPLGYLAHRSGLFPRSLGVLLVVAGGSWIVDTLVGFIAPDLPALAHTMLTAPTIAEFWLVLYLLVKGVRTSAPERLDPLAV